MNTGLGTLLLAAFAAAAQQQPAAQKPGVVEGAVVNSVTGAPLRKADVTLANGNLTEEMVAMVKQFNKGTAMPGQHVATKTLGMSTDAEGKFRFENVAPGTYWLTVKKAGFGDVHYTPKAGGGEDGASFYLASGQEMSRIEVRMVPHGSISGRVLDEDGDPYPTANVTAQKYSYGRGHRRLAPADFARTNGRGEFTLGNLPPGSYFICADVQNVDIAVKPPPPPADGAPETAYVGTYYPSTIDVSQAQKIEVAPGGEVNGLSILLRKSRVVRVSGKLVDAGGAPIKTAQVMLMDSARVGSMSMRLVNDPEGKFELTNLQPGTYTAMVMQMQGSSPKMTMVPLFVPEKNLENVKLGPPPEGTIQGSVTLDGDAAVKLQDFTVILTPAQPVAVMPATAKADSAGAFVLEHVTAASYDLVLAHIPAGAYLKSVMFNGREALGQPLDCMAGAAGTLHIVLGTDGGRVDALVKRDDKPVSDATVVLLPADPARRFPDAVRTVSSNQFGHALLKDVPPADYLLFAWEKIEDDQWFDPDFMKTVESGAVKVTVRSKSGETAEVPLIPAGK